MSTATRVIINTCYLYARMGITMFISLYTTRLILNSLGVSDFGIFNIVGGAIGMLGFLNAAMASATQRFMSYAEGEGNNEKKKIIFNVSLLLHVIISFIVGIALFIAGYLFFNGILNIPSDRIFSAKIVYGSLIISTMFTVMSVPYDAIINAHEDMRYYAVVGILESLLKLAVAFVCVYTIKDKLIVYGTLMACIPLITLTIMRIYCHKRYKECTIDLKRYWDRNLMKEMTGFAGWNFFSSMSSMVTMQGVSIVLNSFWGVLANAAQGIATQLSGQITTFSNVMLKALNPVIVKREGAHDRYKMLEAAMSGNKLSFLIMSFFTIPSLLEMPYILKLWLKNPPEYAILFCRLVLLRLAMGQLTITFGTAIGSTGKIKQYTLMTSLIMLGVLPLNCLLYNLSFPIYTIYIVLIVMVVLLFISSLFFMHKQCDLKIKDYVKEVLFPCIMVSLLTFLICLIPHYLIGASFIRLILVCGFSSVSFIVLFYKIGLNQKEKNVLLAQKKKILHR